MSRNIWKHPEAFGAHLGEHAKTSGTKSLRFHIEALTSADDFGALVSMTKHNTNETFKGKGF